MANTPANHKENILVGAASLYIGNVSGTGKPAYAAESYRTTLEATAWNSAVTDLTLASAWRGVGYTMEGLEVSYEPDYGDVEVDQLLDSALVFKQAMKVSLNTTLAEATLLNLMVAWGQSGSTLTSDASSAELVVQGGSLGDAPIERAFVAVGNGNYGRAATDVSYSERVYQKYRVLNVESSAHSLKRNEATGIPVSFRALPADDGTYGKIKDRKKTW
jgi:hypothetical protein